MFALLVQILRLVITWLDISWSELGVSQHKGVFRQNVKLISASRFFTQIGPLECFCSLCLFTPNSQCFHRLWCVGVTIFITFKYLIYKASGYAQMFSSSPKIFHFHDHVFTLICTARICIYMQSALKFSVGIGTKSHWHRPKTFRQYLALRRSEGTWRRLWNKALCGSLDYHHAVS